MARKNLFTLFVKVVFSIFSLMIKILELFFKSKTKENKPKEIISEPKIKIKECLPEFKKNKIKSKRKLPENEQNRIITQIKEKFKEWPENIQELAKPLIDEIIKKIESGESVSDTIKFVIQGSEFSDEAKKAMRESLSFAVLKGYGILPEISVGIALANDISRIKTYSEFINDKNIVAVRWKLLPTHKKNDICKLYANVDFFNLGPGIYPNKPECIPDSMERFGCYYQLYAIYNNELNVNFNDIKLNIENARKYLEKLSYRTIELILGEKVYQLFKENKNWDSELWPEKFGKLSTDRICEILYGKNFSGDLKNFFRRIENLSCHARHHFIDILNYRDFPKKYYDVHRMTFYETRCSDFSSEKTVIELINANLIHKIEITDKEPGFYVEIEYKLMPYEKKIKKILSLVRDDLEGYTQAIIYKKKSNLGGLYE